MKTILQSRHGRDLPIDALAVGYGTYKTVSPMAARRAVRWAGVGKRQGPFLRWDDDHADADAGAEPILQPA